MISDEADVIEIKYTISVIHLSHPQTTSSLVHGKIVFHETTKPGAMRLRITDLGYILMKSGLECTFLDLLWSTLYPAFFLHREHVYFRVIWTILRVFFSPPVVFDLYLSTGVRAGILFSSDSQRGKSMTQNRFNITVGDIDDVLIRRVRKVRKCTVVHTMEMYTQDTQCGFPRHLPPSCPHEQTLQFISIDVLMGPYWVSGTELGLGTRPMTGTWFLLLRYLGFWQFL